MSEILTVAKIKEKYLNGDYQDEPLSQLMDTHLLTAIELEAEVNAKEAQYIYDYANSKRTDVKKFVIINYICNLYIFNKEYLVNDSPLKW
jgi:hypothetical protein